MKINISNKFIFICCVLFCCVITLNITYMTTGKSSLKKEKIESEQMHKIQEDYFLNFNELMKNKLTFGDVLPNAKFEDIYGNSLCTGDIRNQVTLFIFKYLTKEDELTTCHKYNKFIKKFNSKLSIIIIYQQTDLSNEVDVEILKMFKYEKNISVIVDGNNVANDIFKIPCKLCGYEILSDKNNLIRLSGAGANLQNLEKIIKRYL